MTGYRLVIGNKNYSSWSLRPWLAMTVAGVAFEEVVIPLRQPETAAAIARWSPSGKVPALHLDGGLVAWESIAILEHVAERAPAAALWPEDPAARAAARSASAEMHAGFQALRSNMPMNVRARKPGRGMTPEVAADVARITQIWRDCRARWGGGDAFLFGRFGAADAMFAPVASRLATYCVALDPVSEAYVQAILALPAMRAWTEAAIAEPWVMPNNEID